jgi:sec-independent protein translocase protein TatC
VPERDRQVEMSFWDHLDVLRGTIFRSVLAITVFSVAVFCFKRLVFDGIVLAPARSDFCIYRWLGMEMRMTLVNLEITTQFFVHLKVAFSLGFILAFPYITFEIWKFIAPALYENEKRAVRTVFLFVSVLFYVGLVVGYYLIVPISLNFFLGYTISDSVQNTISLQSYISLFTSTLLAFGIVFEFPAAVTILSRIGIITREMLIKYRRHAIVILLIIAAFITPADPFSLVVAFAPLYLLFELSVLSCRKAKPES